MLTIRIIPCLDCRDGRVVKGIQFVGLRDAGDPVELACRYQDEGADELVLLDIAATPAGRNTHLHTVRNIRKHLGIPLTVGGGVRSLQDAGALLDAGADKIGVNTAAVSDPSLIHTIAERFGNQCVVLAMDAALRLLPATTHESAYEVVVQGGHKRTGIDALQWAKTAVERGAGEILLTSLDRDGTGAGYDTQLLKLISDAVHVPVIASGGASSPQDLLHALQAGAEAVLAASIFHDQRYSIGDVKKTLAQNGIRVRL